MAGRIGIQLVADSSKFRRGMNDAILGLNKFALSAAAIGTAIAHSMRVATRFNMEMVKLETLVGVSRKEVDKMTDSVLNMAGEVGKTPQELAQGLYFITSSGLEGAKAMEALEYSAKASALGMGETTQIADALTSILNAYGHEAYTASEATNILLQTVKLGKIEADQLAASIGKVIPTASMMGVSFEEVGSALATMSLSGIDAAEATTALNMMLTSLLNPSEQARDVINELYGSAENLRREIAEKGLNQVLNDLARELDGDVEKTAKLFNEKRALKAMLSLTGEQLGTYNEILAASANRVDEFGGAVNRWAEEPGAKWLQLMSKLEGVTVSVGDKFADLAMRWYEWETDTKMNRIKNWVVWIEDKMAQLGITDAGRMPSTPFDQDFPDADTDMFPDKTGSKSTKEYERSLELARKQLKNWGEETEEEVKKSAGQFELLDESLDGYSTRMKEFLIEGKKRWGEYNKEAEKSFFYAKQDRGTLDITAPEYKTAADLGVDDSTLWDQMDQWEKMTTSIDTAQRALQSFGAVYSAVMSNNMMALNAQHEAEMKAFEDKNRGASNYSEKLKELQEKQRRERNAELKKQAQIKKMLGLFEAMMNVPIAISQGTAIGGPPLGAIYGALASAQVAAIAAMKVPSFRIGTTAFEGGPAVLHPGETLTNLPAGTKVESKGMSRYNGGGEFQIRLDRDEVILALRKMDRDAARI